MKQLVYETRVYCVWNNSGKHKPTLSKITLENTVENYLEYLQEMYYSSNLIKELFKNKNSGGTPCKKGTQLTEKERQNLFQKL